MRNARIHNLLVKGLLVALGSVGVVAASAANSNFFDATRHGYPVACLKAQPEGCVHDYWFYMGVMGESVLFIDNRERKIDHVRWLLEMPMEGQKDFGRKSELTAMEFNCTTGEIRVKRRTSTDKPWGHGAVLTEDDQSDPWIVPAPESVGEKLYDMVCVYAP